MATLQVDCRKIIVLKSVEQYRIWLWTITNTFKQFGKRKYMNNKISNDEYDLAEDKKLRAVILSTVDITSIAMKITEPEDGTHDNTLTSRCLNEIENLIKTGANRINIIQQILKMEKTRNKKKLVDKIRNLQYQITFLNIDIEEILAMVIYNSLEGDIKNKYKHILYDKTELTIDLFEDFTFTPNDN